MYTIPLKKNSCQIIYPNILICSSSRRRQNHDMVEEGVHIVPTLRNRVVIFLYRLKNITFYKIYSYIQYFARRQFCKLLHGSPPIKFFL